MLNELFKGERTRPTIQICSSEIIMCVYVWLVAQLENSQTHCYQNLFLLLQLDYAENAWLWLAGRRQMVVVLLITYWWTTCLLLFNRFSEWAWRCVQVHSSSLQDNNNNNNSYMMERERERERRRGGGAVKQTEGCHGNEIVIGFLDVN